MWADVRPHVPSLRPPSILPLPTSSSATRDTDAPLMESAAAKSSPPPPDSAETLTGPTFLPNPNSDTAFMARSVARLIDEGEPPLTERKSLQNTFLETSSLTRYIVPHLMSSTEPVDTASHVKSSAARPPIRTASWARISLRGGERRGGVTVR